MEIDPKPKIKINPNPTKNSRAHTNPNIKFCIVDNDGVGAHKVTSSWDSLPPIFSYALVETAGVVDCFELKCGDRLVLGAPESTQSGDLVILKDSLNMIGYVFARQYGHYFIDVFHQKVMSINRWEVIGTVIAIERPLGHNTALMECGHVRLQGLSSRWSAQIEHNKVCHLDYVQLLSQYLRKHHSDSSLLVAVDSRFLEVDMPLPKGVIWTIPSFHEAPMEADNIAAYRAVFDRNRRRLWQSRTQIPKQFNCDLPFMLPARGSVPLVGK